jgi:hypothetical protein
MQSLYPNTLRALLTDLPTALYNESRLAKDHQNNYLAEKNDFFNQNFDFRSSRTDNCPRPHSVE